MKAIINIKNIKRNRFFSTLCLERTLLLSLLFILHPSSLIHTWAQPYAVYEEGLIGDIHPKGWLLEFLNRQKTGLTGHPEAMAYPYNSCLWAGEIPRVNENPDAKDWWRYEQTAYYTDGLLRLGYLLDDEDFIGTGEAGISYTLEHAQSNGRLGNSKIESLWPMAVFFRAMQADYWVTGNQAIVNALERNYLSLNTSLLTNGRRHIVNLEGMLWTYGKTGNQQLLTMAEQAYNQGGFELDAALAASNNVITMHGVTYAEMLKIPLLLYAYTGNQRYLDLALNAERKLERDHLLPDGLYTSAEYTEGRDIDSAHETCDITDYTWSLGYFLQVTGEAEWADRLERAIFNAGLGAITKDFKALQYFSSVNQLICTGTSDNNAFKRGSTWMAYRPIHETECCVGNVNRFMPNFASRLWMRGKQGEVVATLYSPNETAFDIDGQRVTITEQTAYPFEETIRFTISTEGGSVSFPLVLRIPGWCEGASLTVNGQPSSITLNPSSFVTLNRSFSDGDVVELNLPMQAKLQEAADGQGWYVERGPLLYTYAIPQQKVEDTKTYSNMNGKRSENPDFKCWSITPNGPYNYGFDPSLVTDELNVNGNDNANGNYPFDLENAPVSIDLPVRKIMWSVQNGRNPNLPGKEAIVATDQTETISLVPYGCTELRLTVFPEASENDIPGESLLVNPDFEMLDADNYNAGGTEHKTWVPYGWSVQGQINGVSYGINSDAKNPHGDNICWFRLLPFSDNFELYQTIPAEKLEPGIYKVSCRLWNNYSQKGNCRLFANNNVQYFGSQDEYKNNQVEGEEATFAGYGGTQDNNFILHDMQVYVTIDEGDDLRVGIRSDGRKSDGTRGGSNDATGWFKVDDFHVEKVDAVPLDNGDEDIELTKYLLTNYDFELNTSGQTNPAGAVSRGVPYGWSLMTAFKGNSYGVSSDGLNKHANNVCWFNNAGGPMPDNFELYQEIPSDKIEPGRYQVRCRLWAEKGLLGTCRLFANNNVQYFGKPTDYQQNQTEGEEATFAGYDGGANNNFIMYEMVVYVDVDEGDPLRLGIRSGNKHSDGTNDNGNSGWFKVDYFRIKKVDSPANVPDPGPGPGPGPVPETASPVFIVCGQSNSDGRIPVADYPEYMQTDRAMYCYDDGTQFQNGQFAPYQPYSIAAGERFAYDAFVYHYIQKSQPDPFYIVKLTLGGTAIDPSCQSNNQWYWSCNPSWYDSQTATTEGGASLMKSFERSFQACRTQTLATLKQGYKVRAILWHQGEADRNAQGPANYYNNLKTLIAHMRQFLYEQTADADCLTLPFILGTVPPKSTQYNADVEAAHLRVAAEDDNVYAINLSGQPLLGDDLHFSVETGDYYGRQVFLKLVDLGICPPVEFEEDLHITDRVMVNPDFELDLNGQPNPRGTVTRGVPYGWEVNTALSGNSFGINKDAFNLHADNVCWMNATPMPEDFILSQTIPAEKLGAGRYTVKCKLWVEVNKKTSCRLFANNVVQYYGTEADYTNLLTPDEEVSYAGFAGGNTNPFILRPLSVTIELADGEDLTVGIHTGNRRNNGQTATDNAGWFKVDNFRVYKEETTGIRNVNLNDNGNDNANNRSSLISHPSSVYDLQGRKVKVNVNANGNSPLKPGIYIVNGRKVVVK